MSIKVVFVTQSSLDKNNRSGLYYRYDKHWVKLFNGLLCANQQKV